jgi:outer membrane murein-binding lipoprotein Lpp
VSAIEALRAALASGPTRTPWDHRGRLTASENHGGYSIISPGGWCLAIVQPIDTDGLTGGLNAAYIAAACNAAPELLAEVDRLKAERDALRLLILRVARNPENAANASALRDDLLTEARKDPRWPEWERTVAA